MQVAVPTRSKGESSAPENGARAGPVARPASEGGAGDAAAVQAVLQYLA